jgi:hypothetical protein
VAQGAGSGGDHAVPAGTWRFTDPELRPDAGRLPDVVGQQRRVGARGRRYRGGPTTEPTASHLPNLPPLPNAPGPSTSSNWGGHHWQPWAPLRGVPVPAGSLGLYRVRDPSLAGLVYVGQGRIRTRLGAHLAKAARPDHPQARWFAALDLECSWTTNDSWLAYQRLELENDLIAAHVLEHGAPPSAQFLG